MTRPNTVSNWRHALYGPLLIAIVAAPVLLWLGIQWLLTGEMKDAWIILWWFGVPYAVAAVYGFVTMFMRRRRLQKGEFKE